MGLNDGFQAAANDTLAACRHNRPCNGTAAARRHKLNATTPTQAQDRKQFELFAPCGSLKIRNTVIPAIFRNNCKNKLLFISRYARG